MGQNSCCAPDHFKKLVQGNQTKIIDFIMGNEGVTKAKEFFNIDLKEKVSAHFNKLAGYANKEKDYMQVMQKIDQDCEGELGKLSNMKNSLNSLDVFKNLPMIQKDSLLEQAKKRFGGEIAERLKRYAQGMKGMYKVEEYLNFLK